MPGARVCCESEATTCAREVGVSMSMRRRPERPSHSSGTLREAAGVSGTIVEAACGTGPMIFARDPLDSPRAKPETANPAATIAVRTKDRLSARRDFPRRDMRPPCNDVLDLDWAPTLGALNIDDRFPRWVPQIDPNKFNLHASLHEPRESPRPPFFQVSRPQPYRGAAAPGHGGCCERVGGWATGVS